MDLTQQLVRLVVSHLPKAAELFPEKFRKKTLARVNDFNPFVKLGAQDDLARALRLAWIEAALKLDKSARNVCRSPEWISQADEVDNFSDLLRSRLKALRDNIFDRDKKLSSLSIDQHLQAVILQTPNTLTGQDTDTSHAITVEFTKIISEIVLCTPSDVPYIYQDMAERGIIISEADSSTTFGDMVLLIFIELIQNPKKYSIAGSAFAIATNGLAVELGQQCLKVLEGQDRRFNLLLEQLDVTSDADGLGKWLAGVDAALASGFDKLTLQIGTLDNKFDQSLDRMANIEQIVAEVAAKLGGNVDPIARKIIIDQAKKLRPDQLMDFTSAVKEIEYAVCAALDLIRTGGTSYYEDRFVNDAYTNVGRSIELGEIDQGSETIDQALAEIDRREARERDAARRQRKQLLNLSIQHGAAALAPHRVADAEAKLIGIEQPERPVMSEEYRARFEHYFHEGETRGVNFLLDVAVELARKRLKYAVSSYERNEALGWLGKSLARLGERSPSPKLLQQAEQVFREAAEFNFQNSMPTEREIAKSNLANVLQSLGRRERNSDKLHEAVKTYESVLLFAKENPLFEASEIYGNLGAVLIGLGEREGKPEFLSKAVHYLEAALNDVEFENSPAAWATAQNNLGNALRIIGEREGDNGLLGAAAQAYRAALTKRTKDISPFLWATTQGDLGTALLTLGERTGNTDLIREAINCLHAALSGRHRDAAPLEWATQQHNLGTAYLRIGELEKNISMLNQAKEAYGLALEGREPLRGHARWAGTISGLGNVYFALGRQEQSAKQLEKAKTAYKKALDYLSYDAQAMDWAMNKYNLGNALLALADHEDGTDSLDEAARAYQDALRVRTIERASAAWGRTKFMLGRVYIELGDRLEDNKHTERAIQEYQSAMPKLSQEQQKAAQQIIAYARVMIQERDGKTS